MGTGRCTAGRFAAAPPTRPRRAANGWPAAQSFLAGGAHLRISVNDALAGQGGRPAGRWVPTGSPCRIGSSVVLSSRAMDDFLYSISAFSMAEATRRGAPLASLGPPPLESAHLPAISSPPRLAVHQLSVRVCDVLWWEATIICVARPPTSELANFYPEHGPLEPRQSRGGGC
jgi:hypothetical protein